MGKKFGILAAGIFLSISGWAQNPHIKREKVKAVDLATSLNESRDRKELPQSCSYDFSSGVPNFLYVNMNHRKSRVAIGLTISEPLWVEIDSRKGTETLEKAYANSRTEKYDFKIVVTRGTVTRIEAKHFLKRRKNVGTTLRPLYKEYWKLEAHIVCT